MIAWTIYVTFAGALLLLALPRNAARWIALVTAAAGLAISCAAFLDARTPVPAREPSSKSRGFRRSGSVVTWPRTASA